MWPLRDADELAASGWQSWNVYVPARGEHVLVEINGAGAGSIVIHGEYSDGESAQILDAWQSMREDFKTHRPRMVYLGVRRNHGRVRTSARTRRPASGPRRTTRQRACSPGRNTDDPELAPVCRRPQLDLAREGPS
jgi:hypothetical protein